ncbi:MAG: lipase family protein, partial [Runella sp.]
MKPIKTIALMGLMVALLYQPAVGQTAAEIKQSLLKEKGLFRHFEFNNTGNSRINVYLLSLLMHYNMPEILADTWDINNAEVRRMHQDNNYFFEKYKSRIDQFFPDEQQPVFRSFHFDGQNGFDPEAVAISCRDYQIVVFRGTDKVLTAKPFEDNAEFIVTDLQARLISTPFFAGRVHQGFNTSLQLIYSDVERFLLDNGGRNKKLWITGHSLGSGLASLFAVRLDRTSALKPHCVYAYAAPAVGDVTFVNDLNNRFLANNTTRFQRFDFIDDPVTKVPFNAMGYRKAGIRNYYSKESGSNYFFRRAEDANDNINGFYCLHHTNWYARAAYFELRDNNPSLADQLPNPPSRPSFLCSDIDFSIVTGGGAVPNMFGIREDVEEGTYYIINARTNQYLEADQENAHLDGTHIQTANFVNNANRFKWRVQKVGGPVGGYTIQALYRNKFVDADDPNVSQNNCKVQLWERKLPIIPDRRNQEWGFALNNDGSYFISNVKDNNMRIYIRESDVTRSTGLPKLINRNNNVSDRN